MSKKPQETALQPWEVELLNIFVGLFDSFGIPKSVAQIYGVLFCAEVALSQEDICQKLQISLGSASQGLRLLTDIGAAHRQSVPGQRGSLFVPERSMRKLLGYFIDAKVRPRMSTGKEKLRTLRGELSAQDTLACSRLDTLLKWEDKMEAILLILSKFLK